MTILSIDPGPDKSAWLLYDTEANVIVEKGIDANEGLLGEIQGDFLIDTVDYLVIEKVECFGMAVGASVFETVFWSGRFTQAHGEAVRIGRKAVKLHLCGSVQAKDSNIRQALIDRFGPPGTKANPGFTYGISKHMWSALAVAVTFKDTILDTIEKGTR